MGWPCAEKLLYHVSQHAITTVRANTAYWKLLPPVVTGCDDFSIHVTEFF